MLISVCWLNEYIYFLFSWMAILDLMCVDIVKICLVQIHEMVSVMLSTVLIMLWYFMLTLEYEINVPRRNGISYRVRHHISTSSDRCSMCLCTGRTSMTPPLVKLRVHRSSTRQSPKDVAEFYVIPPPSVLIRLYKSRELDDSLWCQRSKCLSVPLHSSYFSKPPKYHVADDL